MTDDEATEIKTYIKNMVRTLRMEYGQAMALEGFGEDVIINVQQRVARELVSWLETT